MALEINPKPNLDQFLIKTVFSLIIFNTKKKLKFFINWPKAKILKLKTSKKNV
jgi:hypothetical protein